MKDQQVLHHGTGKLEHHLPMTQVQQVLEVLIVQEVRLMFLGLV